MLDSAGASGVRKLLVRRDQLLDDNASDKIAFVLDPYHDRQTRVWCELNPLGVKGDHRNGDASFDPVWIRHPSSAGVRRVAYARPSRGPQPGLQLRLRIGKRRFTSARDVGRRRQLRQEHQR